MPPVSPVYTIFRLPSSEASSSGASSSSATASAPTSQANPNPRTTDARRSTRRPHESQQQACDMRGWTNGRPLNPSIGRSRDTAGHRGVGVSTLYYRQRHARRSTGYGEYQLKTTRGVTMVRGLWLSESIFPDDSIEHAIQCSSRVRPIGGNATVPRGPAGFTSRA